MYAVSQTWLQNRQGKNLSKLLTCFLGFLFLIWIWVWHGPFAVHTPLQDSSSPLVDKYIGGGIGDGGRWHIPQSWYDGIRATVPYPSMEDYPDVRNPRDPLEAAHQALELVMRKKRYMTNTKIPLIIHQTWKNEDSDNWRQDIKESVEGWLATAMGEAFPDQPEMAYVLWDDYGVDQFFALYEPGLWESVQKLPHFVEKADIFRIAVLKWFGGVYADIDTHPLQHPSLWVQVDDLKSWIDVETQHKFGLHNPLNQSYIAPEDAPFRPHLWPDSKVDLTPADYKTFMKAHAPHEASVAAILGIEADTRADSDDYWRMGYTYPVQLTNWAFAMAPHHPIASAFLKQVDAEIIANSTRLDDIDPLDLTGPPALTKLVKQYSESVEAQFRWQGLSGLDDREGGRGKITAGDVLVLSITGFSPGRGTFHNMGSMPLENSNARLFHAAAGSWRKLSFKVEAGKFCRTFLGRCKEWKKVP